MKSVNELFLNSKDVGKCLSIPLRTLQYLSKTGKIKAIKVGKQWRYKKSDIENYITFGTNFSKEPIKEKNNFIEKRTYSRINTDFDCHYSINLPRFKIINNIGIVKNLSAGGILAICQDDGIEIGDPINLEFMDIRTEGRIVRRDKNEFGIKFRNIDERIKEKIVQYIG